MAKRKLVKQGAATLMVSIPSKWAKKFNLDKGDEVEVEEKGNSLVLGIEGKKAKTETELNLTSLTETSVRTLITNAYRLGYDKILLNYKEKSTLDTIKDVVEHNLVGFEISKNENNKILIENITEPSADQFNNIFSKIFMNIDELFIIAEKMMLGQKNQSYRDVELKIQQFDNFCRRIITKKNLHEEYLLQWVFHSELIHAQRYIYLMLDYLNKNKVKPDKQEAKLIEEAKKIFDTLKEAYYKKDISLLEKIHDLNKEMVYKHCYNAMENGKEVIINHNLTCAIRGFYLASSPLIGLFMSQKK
jgi:phosphate uptake regulator